MNPIFSIVIPSYNRKEMLLKRSLPSAFSQSGRNCEIIVIDDGSGDNTEAALAALTAQKKIRYFRQPKNLGVSAARNRGVKEAKGEVIIFLDSDDELLPDYATAAEEIFFDPIAEVMMPGFALRDEHGKENFTHSSRKASWLLGMGGGIAYRRSVFTGKQIWYDEHLRNFEDSDFGFRVARACRIVFYDKPLYIYNYETTRGAKNLSTDPEHLFSDFKIFKDKNFSFYQSHGPAALSYLIFWEATLYSAVDIKKARKLFWRAFRLHSDWRGLAYFLMSAFGSKKIYNFLYRRLVAFRRRYKTFRHSL